MSTIYPLDLSGVNPANLVKAELHTVTEAHFRDYYFLIPNFAPFYTDNFKGTITIGTESRPLVEDVDFSFTLSAVTGTRVTGKAMYGGITLHNLNLNGIVTIEYQTVGGDQLADRLQVLTCLADKAYNPKVTNFDILTGVPEKWPPSDHYQDYDTFYGQDKVIVALIAIRDAIIQNSSLTQDQLKLFLEALGAGELDKYIKRAGDQMTGSLILKGNPTQDNEAATKKYVDTAAVSAEYINNALSNYFSSEQVDSKLSDKLDKTGGTVTGPITFEADPTLDGHLVNKNYVDELTAGIQNTVNQLTDQVNAIGNDKVTKEYVDERINELKAYIDSILLGRM